MLPWWSPMQLNLDVAGIFDKLLDIHGGIAKGAPGFARGVAKSRFQLLLAIHAAHPFPPPPATAFSITG